MSSYSNKRKETKKKRKKWGKVNNDYYYEDEVFNIYLDGLSKLLDMEERLRDCNSTINTLCNKINSYKLDAERELNEKDIIIKDLQNTVENKNNLS